MPLLEVFHPLGRTAMNAWALGLAGCWLIGMAGLTVLIREVMLDLESEEDDSESGEYYQILYCDIYLLLAGFAAWFVYLVVWMHTASLDEAGTLVDMSGAPATVQNVRQGKLERYLRTWFRFDLFTVMFTFAGVLRMIGELAACIQVIWLLRSWIVYRTCRAHRLKASNESLDDEGVYGAAPPPIVVGTVVGEEQDASSNSLNQGQGVASADGVVGTVVGQEQDASSNSLNQGQGVASADVPSGIVVLADVPSGNDMCSVCGTSNPGSGPCCINCGSKRESNKNNIVDNAP